MSYFVLHPLSVVLSYSNLELESVPLAVDLLNIYIRISHYRGGGTSITWVLGVHEISQVLDCTFNEMMSDERRQDMSLIKEKTSVQLLHEWTH